MIKTYQYKLYRSKRNRHFDKAIDTAASIWNYCIAFHRRYYKLYGKHLSANRLMKHITKLKKHRFCWWNQLARKRFRTLCSEWTAPTRRFFSTISRSEKDGNHRRDLRNAIGTAVSL